MKPIRAGELPNPAPHNVMLHCEECDSTYSADKADYWNVPKNEVMTCGCTEEPLRLIRKRVILEDVKP